MKKQLLGILQDTRSQTMFETIWLFSPFAIWFSYQPLISFGRNSSTNFELSVVLIYLIVLAVSGIPWLWRGRKTLISSRAVWLVSGFVGLSTISLLWTSDLTRGLLTAGVIGLLYLVFLESFVAAERLKRLAPNLCSFLLASALFMSLLSFAQLIAGIWLQGQQPLLCQGCTANQFGFVRPNVFAAEPQFFGNLLLAPSLILLYRLAYNKWRHLTVICFLIITTALFLTLSRGSIFAFALGAGVLFMTKLPSFARLLRLAGLVLACFFVCLGMQGTAASLNPRLQTTFRQAISASINQLSLGIIDLPEPEVTPQPKAPAIPVSTQEADTNFDGYVEQSTNVRLKLSKLALSSWNDNPARMMFGVGLGGSGATLRQEFPQQVNDREIVQNEFVEILFESGVIGLGLFVLMLGALLIGLHASKLTWLQSLIIAFVVQWNFFSGYPNALHIYLLLIIMAVLIVGKGHEVRR